MFSSAYLAWAFDAPVGQGTVQEKPNYNDNSGADLFTYMKEGLKELLT